MRLMRFKGGCVGGFGRYIPPNPENCNPEPETPQPTPPAPLLLSNSPCPNVSPLLPCPPSPSLSPPPSSSWQVLHRLPGRIRIRVPELSRYEHHALWLEAALVVTPGVTQLRLNRTASSVVIQYQPDAAEQIWIRLGELLGELDQACHHGSGLNGTSHQNSADPAPSKPLSQPKDVQPVHASNHWASLQLPGLASALAFASQFPSLRWLRPLAATTLALTVWAYCSTRL